MSTSSLEKTASLPLSEQVFTDEYWGDSELAELRNPWPDNQERDNYARLFKSTVHHIRNGKTSPMLLADGSDFANLPLGYVVEFDFDSLMTLNTGKLRRASSFMLKVLAPDNDQPKPPKQTNEHLDWKIGCSADQLIAITNRDQSPTKPLRPGTVPIIRRFPHQPDIDWGYLRSSWYGIIMPNKKNDGRDLYSFSYLPGITQALEGAASAGLVPAHRPLYTDRVTHSVIANQMRLEKIRSLRAYPPVRLP